MLMILVSLPEEVNEVEVLPKEVITPQVAAAERELVPQVVAAERELVPQVVAEEGSW